jgi:mono/diheme cytochrome c family protein
MIKCSSILLPLLAVAHLPASEVSFSKDIWPIMKESCVSCHGPDTMKRNRRKSAKAGLRLDSKASIMEGSEDGTVITVGKAEKSSFYTLTTLGEDHDDVMPPKGDLLTVKEQKLIKDWINGGAKFGDWSKATATELKAIFPDGYLED